MISSLVKGMLTLGSLSNLCIYGTLNYGTYQTLNNHIVNEDVLRPVEFSPLFNYHNQIKSRLDERKMNKFSYEGPLSLCQDVHLGLEVDRQDWIYSVSYKPYVIGVGRMIT